MTVETKIEVEIIESDSFSGQQVDKILRFPTEEKAQEFITKYNSRNNEVTAPEWYMYARLKHSGFY
jgi:hypothetical protein